MLILLAWGQLHLHDLHLVIREAGHNLWGVNLRVDINLSETELSYSKI